jgi:hypothetical protein
MIRPYDMQVFVFNSIKNQIDESSFMHVLGLSVHVTFEEWLF